MASLPRRLAASQFLAAANSTFYTSTGIVTQLDDVSVCNTSASPVTITIDIVDSGGTAGAIMRLISNRVLAANETYPCPELRGKYLNAGDSIQGIASVAGVVSFRPSGRIVSGV